MEYEALGRKQKEESCPNYCKAKAKSLNIKAPMDLRLKGKKKKKVKCIDWGSYLMC